MVLLCSKTATSYEQRLKNVILSISFTKCHEEEGGKKVLMGGTHQPVNVFDNRNLRFTMGGGDKNVSGPP